MGSLWFTVGFALCTTLLQIALGLGLALLTVGEGFVLRLSRTLLMLPMVVAPIAVGTIWRMILSARVGPLNKGLAALGIEGPNWLGDPALAKLSLVLIDAWEWTPFAVDHLHGRPDLDPDRDPARRGGRRRLAGQHLPQHRAGRCCCP